MPSLIYRVCFHQSYDILDTMSDVTNSLGELELCECAISDRGLSFICVCKNLRKLDLNATKTSRADVTSEGMLHQTLVPSHRVFFIIFINLKCRPFGTCDKMIFIPSRITTMHQILHFSGYCSMQFLYFLILLFNRYEQSVFILLLPSDCVPPQMC